MKRPRSSRVLATVVFTDIVGSSEVASQLGDRRWRVLLTMHHRVVRGQLKRFDGTEVDTAGDGFFATFSDQEYAVCCACAISDAVRELGIEVRSGVHVGQVERVGGSLGGIAVHTGARVMASAGPGEVLVSGVLKDLVAGSDFVFADRGLHHLKGISGDVHLYAVSAVDGIPRPPPLERDEAQRRWEAIESPPLLIRRRGGVGLIAGVAVALLVSVLVVLLVVHGTGGNAAGGQSLAPINALVRIDPVSDRVAGEPIRLAQGPGQIAVSGGSVWVVSPTARVLERVDPVTGRVAKRISLPGTPTGIAAGASGSVWIALGLVNRVARFRSKGGGVLQESAPLGCCAGPRLVAVNSKGVFVTGPGGVTRIDPGTGSSALPGGGGDSGIAADLQSVWLGNGWDQVKVVSPELSAGLAGSPTTVSVRGGPTGLAYGDGFVWAAARYLRRVAEIDLVTSTVARTIGVGRNRVASRLAPGRCGWRTRPTGLFPELTP